MSVRSDGDTRERIIVYSRETRGLAAFICHSQTSAGSALFTIKITHTNDKEKSLTKKWNGNELNISSWLPLTYTPGIHCTNAVDCEGIDRVMNVKIAKERHKPSAKGTTIRARSTNTVLVRCWETPTDSGSWNFTKHTREVTGKGESLKENIDAFARCTHKVQQHLLQSRFRA